MNYNYNFSANAINPNAVGTRLFKGSTNLTVTKNNSVTEQALNMTITFNDPYKQFSLEELRTIDYIVNRNMRNQPNQFGGFNNGQNSLWNNTGKENFNNNVFSTNNQNGIFNSNCGMNNSTTDMMRNMGLAPPTNFNANSSNMNMDINQTQKFNNPFGGVSNNSNIFANNGGGNSNMNTNVVMNNNSNSNQGLMSRNIFGNSNTSTTTSNTLFLPNTNIFANNNSSTLGSLGNNQNVSNTSPFGNNNNNASSNNAFFNNNNTTGMNNNSNGFTITNSLFMPSQNKGGSTMPLGSVNNNNMTNTNMSNNTNIAQSTTSPFSFNPQPPQSTSNPLSNISTLPQFSKPQTAPINQSTSLPNPPLFNSSSFFKPQTNPPNPTANTSIPSGSSLLRPSNPPPQTIPLSTSIPIDPSKLYSMTNPLVNSLILQDKINSIAMNKENIDINLSSSYISPIYSPLSDIFHSLEKLNDTVKHSLHNESKGPLILESERSYSNKPSVIFIKDMDDYKRYLAKENANVIQPNKTIIDFSGRKSLYKSSSSRKKKLDLDSIERLGNEVYSKISYPRSVKGSFHMYKESNKFKGGLLYRKGSDEKRTKSTDTHSIKEEEPIIIQENEPLNKTIVKENKLITFCKFEFDKRGMESYQYKHLLEGLENHIKTNISITIIETETVSSMIKLISSSLCNFFPISSAEFTSHITLSQNDKPFTSSLSVKLISLEIPITVSLSPDITTALPLISKYNSSPSLSQMEELSYESLFSLNEFSIFNSNGRVSFLQSVDVSNVNFDEFITLDPLNVSISSKNERYVKFSGVKVQIEIFNMKINSEHVYKQIKEKLEKEGATMTSYDKEKKVLKFTNVIN